MAEALAEYLSKIESPSELEEALKKVPPQIRGRVAELTATAYERKFSVIENEIKFRDKTMSPQGQAQEIMKGLIKMVHIMPYPKVCRLIALESYKEANDSEGLKRIGDSYVKEGDFKAAISIFESIDSKLLDEERVNVLLYIKSEITNKNIRKAPSSHPTSET